MRIRGPFLGSFLLPLKKPIQQAVTATGISPGTSQDPIRRRLGLRLGVVRAAWAGAEELRVPMGPGEALRSVGFLYVSYMRVE